MLLVVRRSATGYTNSPFRFISNTAPSNCPIVAAAIASFNDRHDLPTEYPISRSISSITTPTRTSSSTSRIWGEDEPRCEEMTGISALGISSPVPCPIRRVSSQESPSGFQSNVTDPRRGSAKLAVIILVPKPLDWGGSTPGPPDSVHCMFNKSPAKRQLTSTRPSGQDRLPYFAALVASSCNAIAKVWAFSGETTAEGPMAVILVFRSF